MLRFILKTLVVLWPFLKNIVFKDRTVLEALRANKQFTTLFALLIIVIITLLVTVLALSDTKNKLQLTQREIEQLHTNYSREYTRNQPIIKERIIEDCVDPDIYDKTNVLRLLEQ